MPRGILTPEQRQRQLDGINNPSNKKKLSESAIHMWRTKDMTERNKKVSESKLGPKHPLWKGDEVGYGAIHEWIGTNMPKPKNCSCGSVKRLEAHNLSKKYLRDFSDWIWVCRSCHNKLEGKDINKNIRNKKLKNAI
jgi:uncharacterized protein YlaI